MVDTVADIASSSFIIKSFGILRTISRNMSFLIADKTRCKLKSASFLPFAVL